MGAAAMGVTLQAPAAADPVRQAAARPTHWAVTAAALSIYRGGELVAQVPASQFGELMFQLAAARRSE